MKHKITRISITIILVLALIAIEKFGFKSSNLEIIWWLTIILVAILGFTLVNFINPPDWLYRSRFFLAGIYCGTLIFLQKSISGDLVMIDYLVEIIICAVLFGLYYPYAVGLRNFKRKGKDSEAIEKPVLKVLGHIIVANGERFHGKLILTDSKLIFLSNKNDEMLIEKDLEEINPVINTFSFLKYPNGIRLEEKEKMVFRIQFPYYWLKKIHKLKSSKTVAITSN